MKLLLCLNLLLGSAKVFADTKSELKSQIAATLNNIRTELSFDLASEQQLSDALSKVNAALTVLEGGGTTPPGANIKLVCASRDNDGRNPFQVARQNPDFSVTKFGGAILNQDVCATAIQAARDLRSHALVCVSKDNDARAPFQAVAIPKEGTSAVKFAVFKTFENCTESVSKGQVNQGFFAVCASRDNDGRSPFTRFVFNSQNGDVTKTQETFKTVEECWSK